MSEITISMPSDIFHEAILDTVEERALDILEENDLFWEKIHSQIDAFVKSPVFDETLQDALNQINEKLRDKVTEVVFEEMAHTMRLKANR